MNASAVVVLWNSGRVVVKPGKTRLNFQLKKLKRAFSSPCFVRQCVRKRISPETGCSYKDVYVDVVRPVTAFKNPQGIKNIFSGKSRRILRVLLVHTYQPYRLERLASETRLSVGQVSQVVRRLQDDDLVVRNSAGCFLNQPRRLLRLFAEELKEDYLQNRTVFSGFSEKEPDSLARSLIASRLAHLRSPQTEGHAHPHARSGPASGNPYALLLPQT